MARSRLRAIRPGWPPVRQGASKQVRGMRRARRRKSPRSPERSQVRARRSEQSERSGSSRPPARTPQGVATDRASAAAVPPSIPAAQPLPPPSGAATAFATKCADGKPTSTSRAWARRARRRKSPEPSRQQSASKSKSRSASLSPSASASAPRATVAGAPSHRPVASPRHLEVACPGHRPIPRYARIVSYSSLLCSLLCPASSLCFARFRVPGGRYSCRSSSNVPGSRIGDSENIFTAPPNRLFSDYNYKSSARVFHEGSPGSQWLFRYSFTRRASRLRARASCDDELFSRMPSSCAISRWERPSIQ